MDKERFDEMLRQLYDVVLRLEQMFPGRPFTPDGHMVGSLGEALAAYHYGLELLPPSTQTHDAKRDGLLVQVKATQGSRIALRSEPRHLLVLKLEKDGSFEEVYNGPGHGVWLLVSNRPRPSNGQYQIGLSMLRNLMKATPQDERLPRVR